MRRGVPEEEDDDANPPGAVSSIELRDGEAVAALTRSSTADHTVFWHAGSVLALPETGRPERYTRDLRAEDFSGGLTMPIAAHVHRDPALGARILFGHEYLGEGEAANEGAAAGPGAGAGEARPGSGRHDAVTLRIGEWDGTGSLWRHASLELDRATWQHDLGVSATRWIVIESPTVLSPTLEHHGVPVPYRWAPGQPTWVAVLRRDSDGSTPAWFELDPCTVTHVLNAHDDADGGVVLHVCRYPAPDEELASTTASVLDPAGIGLCPIGGGLGQLERWRIPGETPSGARARVQRDLVDDRFVEYPRTDPRCETSAFRYGYAVEIGWNAEPVGLVRVDVARDETRSWSPGPGRTASEPLFVRAADGQSDDEGWLLTLVSDPERDGTDLYVLDASSFSSRSRPQAVVHLPIAIPFGGHGEWVPADQYR
ncbi:MAG TPA: carotenoid oxygenase family protein [Acidimicrobiales bacterium]|nr:carotenoid oxygenase family protein [Acidimicrobiales bacterium]